MYIARTRVLAVLAGTSAECHDGLRFSDAPKLHAATEIGTEPNEARRYRHVPNAAVARRLAAPAVLSQRLRR